MYGTWPSSVVNSSGKNRIQIIFDTIKDGIPDYVGSIADANGHLRMIIRGHGSQFEPIPATRPDDNTVPCTSRRLAALPDDGYQVATKSVFFPSSGREGRPGA